MGQEPQQAPATTSTPEYAMQEDMNKYFATHFTTLYSATDFRLFAQSARA